MSSSNAVPRIQPSARRPAQPRNPRPPAPSRTPLVLTAAAALLVTGTAAVTPAGPAAVPVAPVPSSTAVHVDNPFRGVRGYVNPVWRSQANQVAGGSKVSNNPTSLWLDRVSLVAGGLPGELGLRDHLDTALDQGAGYIQVVLKNLPGADCDRDFDGEFQPDEVDRYQREFIDPIAEIEADPKYRSLRVINIVEPRWVRNLVVNTGSRATATDRCNLVAKEGTFVTGVRYALTRLRRAAPNLYTYLDAGNYDELGWSDNARPAIQLIVDTVRGTPDGFASVDGFATNIEGYAPLTEPHFTIDSTVDGVSVRRSRWVNWNNYVDELPHALQVRAALIAAGFSDHIGMIIDTSRNGWGGPDRPTRASTARDLETFVDESRVDRRPHTQSWCNQVGAGLGERPVAAPQPGIDAYAWIKVPGESDGSEQSSGAMPDAPNRGRWFPAAFTVLLNNAYPPLP